MPPRADILDVGTGAGHWALTVAQVVIAARFTLFDRDISALDDALLGEINRLSDRTVVCSGSAYALPFPSNAFDFVTAQTLLIHLADPQVALGEMLRVLRPGGLLVCTEPFDLINCARVDPTMLDEGPQALVEHFEFWTRFHHGRKLLGLGDLNIAVRLPDMFRRMDLQSIRAWQSDRTVVLQPPYSSPEEHAFVSDALGAPRVESDQLVAIAVAGGCDERLARAYLAQSAQRSAERRSRLLAQTLTQTWSSGLQIVAGRKA